MPRPKLDQPAREAHGKMPRVCDGGDSQEESLARARVGHVMLHLRHDDGFNAAISYGAFHVCAQLAAMKRPSFAADYDTEIWFAILLRNATGSPHRHDIFARERFLRAVAHAYLRAHLIAMRRLMFIVISQVLKLGEGDFALAAPSVRRQAGIGIRAGDGRSSVSCSTGPRR